MLVCFVFVKKASDEYYNSNGYYLSELDQESRDLAQHSRDFLAKMQQDQYNYPNY